MAALTLLVVLALLAAPLYALLSSSNGESGLIAGDLPLQVGSGVAARGAAVGGEFVPDEVLVKFVRGAGKNAIDGLRVGQGAEELYASPFSSVRRWRIPSSKSVEDWVDFFNKNPLVEYAEPNYYCYAFVYPNDPYYDYQWNFDDDHTFNPGGAPKNPYGGANGGGIAMEDAWLISNGSSDVVIAVVDTGVAYENYAIPSYEKNPYNPYLKSNVNTYQQAPDLAGTSFWVNQDEVPGNGLDDDANGFVDDVNGWDFINDDAHPNDNNFHGTHVAGTVAQTTDNGLGVAGIAFHTTVMPVKVLDYKGDGTDLSVAEGIYYAVDNGADVISLSLGGPDPSSTLEDAVEYAYDHGVVVIAASGNDGVGSVRYPAAYDSYVIAVGATRYDETRPSYSNYGSSLDVVAPGGDLSVNQNGDGYFDGVLQMTFKPYQGVNSKADPTSWGYYFLDGTSMATPHVSGVATLLLAQSANLTPDQVRYALESTAEDKGDPGRDDVYGWGLVDAKAALLSLGESVHIMLTVDPLQSVYAEGQPLALKVTVFDGLLPLDSTLTLTVTGPSSYYLYDFQAIEVEANEVKDYSFSWVVPDAAGRYVVEVGLVPAQLTAYDVAWLEVGTSTAYFAVSDFAESSERWADAADQIYSSDFQSIYDYFQAAVSVQYSVVGETLTGTLRAENLKPNFAYQLKLVGSPGVDGNERIGLAGRWWEQVWTGSAWSGGSNLNSKGDGSSPNPNDDKYFLRRDILDFSSDTGYHYKYTGYLLFAYFITDGNGDATVTFETGDSCHVLWRTDVRTRTANDGPLVSATFDADGTEPAYDSDYPIQTVSIFGEWERLPMGEVDLAVGDYDCQMVLTEESFHGSGLYGYWATVMDANVSFTIG